MAALHIRMKWAQNLYVKHSSLHKSSDILTTKLTFRTVMRCIRDSCEVNTLYIANMREDNTQCGKVRR